MMKFGKVSLGERDLYNSPDCNGNVAVAERRPHWSGKREFRLCKLFSFASNTKLLKFIATVIMIVFLQDAIAQTAENLITGLRTEVAALLPYSETELQILTEADLPATLVINKSVYNILNEYDEFLKQSLSENGDLNTTLKKCLIFFDSKKIDNSRPESSLSPKPKSSTKPID